MVQSVWGSSRRLWSLSSALPSARAPTLCLWLWAAPAMGNGLGVPGTWSRPWLGTRPGPGTRARQVVVGDEEIYAERR
jgi:hypothetical protein